MDSIENFAQTGISLEISPEVTAEALACRVDHNSAVLLLPPTGETTAQAVLHELLHIHRYWNEQIPKIMPVSESDSRWSIANAIDNSLEHTIIVPREAEYGFEPYGYWNAVTRRNFSDYPWPEIADQFARRKNCLIGWLYCSKLIDDADVKETVRSALRSEGLLHDGEQFAAKVSRLASNKAQMISAAIRFLHIPRKDVRLLYCDIQGRRRRIEEVPAY